MVKKPAFVIITAAIFLFLCSGVAVFANEEGQAALGSQLPIWSCIPFAGMLLSIAILPLIIPRWWEHHQLHVAIFWSALFLVPFANAFGVNLLAFHILQTVLLDYLPFIVLLFGLFVSAGGIALRGTLVGTTRVNVTLFLIGTVLSSWIGTTGAAMLMIRPVIRANVWRKKKRHVIIFFIFMVANIGGCLTPLGDPPLFLGFLRGVPFFWTMKLLPIMLLNIIILSAIFVILDKSLYRQETAALKRRYNIEKTKGKDPLRIEGAHNFIFIVMIIGAVILNGILSRFELFANPRTGELHGINIAGVLFPFSSMVQIAIILLGAFLSMKTTQKATRDLNCFTFGPIAEIARLFIGIFLTMIPALAILKANGDSLGLHEPWQFFWATGAMSSFLDNTPTYLAFLTTAGAAGFTEGVVTTVGTIAAIDLMAVSAGAVFMGANTYIGNAPNFMIKSIAEENNVNMPGFFGYMAWSLFFLIPLFVIDTLIFFI